MTVKDSDVDHFTFTTLGGNNPAGVPFAATAKAYDALGNPITVYNGTATLTAVGQSGSLSISPTSVTFVSGVWTGNVTVNAVDPSATLHLTTGTGATGASNAFTVYNELQVVSTTPAAGGTFTLPGPCTYDVTFNEPINPSSVATSSLVLSGISGAAVVRRPC